MGTSNSQTATAGTTATALTWPQFFPTIVVVNEGTQDVFLTTDGTDAVADADGMDVVLPGQQAVFANRAAPPDITRSDWPGTTTVSLITSTGSSLCTVSPQ